MLSGVHRTHDNDNDLQYTQYFHDTCDAYRARTVSLLMRQEPRRVCEESAKGQSGRNVY